LALSSVFLGFFIEVRVRVRICFSLGNTHATNKKSPFLSGAELKKMELPYKMNDRLAQSSSHVHSYIRDFSQPNLNPNLVFEQLYKGVELSPEVLANLSKEEVKLPEPIAGLLKLYGIGGNNKQRVYDEVKEVIELYMRESNVDLPADYNVNELCDMFIGPDSARSLQGTFADLFFFAQGGKTWVKGIIPFVEELWKAEEPDSPITDPNSPILGGEGPTSPFSVLESTGEIPEGIEIANVDLDNLVNPLDQFGLHSYISLHIGNFYFSFTNLALSMLLSLGFVLLVFFLVTKKGGGKSVPNALQSLVELIYDFVLNLVNEQIGGLSGNVKQKFFPRISVTFTFSLFRNPQGMIPFSFTVTSHFLITLALSFSIFIGITIVGFQRHGLHFFSFLLPAGVPLPLAPFLVLLELISYCFRALSLGIRLFANMMAGHSLVKILSGFAWTMLFLNNIFYFIGDLGPLFIILALTGLELGVAISQAHVSTISICIYLNDAINLH
jgi:F-type H+-transporting ATPase subunit a